MPKTPKGFYQRSANGRFYYGRVSDYRLRKTMTAEPDTLGTTGSGTPVSGSAPLTVTLAVDASTSITPTMVGMRASWPAQAGVTGGGEGVIPKQAGLAATGRVYPRVNGSSPTDNATQKFNPGDGSPLTANVAYGGNTTHAYAAGTHVPQLVATDTMGRTSTKDLTPVVVGGHIPLWTVNPTAAVVAATTATFDGTPDSTGTVYIKVVASGDPAPTCAAIKISALVPDPMTATGACVAATPISRQVTGLTTGTAYDAYLCVEAGGVMMASPYKVSFITL